MKYVVICLGADTEDTSSFHACAALMFDTKEEAEAYAERLFKDDRDEMIGALHDCGVENPEDYIVTKKYANCFGSRYETRTTMKCCSNFNVGYDVIRLN